MTEVPGRMPPRVRIAPSPTGDPHVGTAYIALFNFAFARRHGGQFVLRIEDTDQERSSRSSETAIFEALRWLGLDWDEGPDKGGPHAPYRQSERLAIYAEHVEQLLARGEAYRCFCSRERLDAVRKAQLAAKVEHPGYDGHCRDLPPAQGAARAAAGEAHVVRMRIPRSGDVVVHDRLRGEVRFGVEQIDDQVLMKSDGFPTYHLANVVDDHLMGITHVIRGEEWLTSTPKHVLLYRAFGWEPPEFYHLGLLRNADRSKLSKRKNPVSVFHYRALGYLPETFLNFLATLGFSMADNRERFSLAELIAEFDLSRLSVGGPVFDPVKLAAWNGEDMRAMSVEALVARLQRDVLDPARLHAIVELGRERVQRLDDFVPFAAFFFGGSIDLRPVLPEFTLKGRTRDEVIEILQRFLDEIEKDKDARSFTKESIEGFARGFCERTGWKTKEIFGLLRLAVVGRTAAPPLFDTLAVCGKDRTRMRLRDAIELLRATAAG
ncbi:MAG: glutamate--tRNA ligase [Nannocystaceae bacterium]|nr:glutamate--tRNA ligase [Nannocystaceae bacterium]